MLHDDGLFFSQEKTVIKRHIAINQYIQTSSYSAARIQFRFPGSKPANHTLYICSRPRRCRHGLARGEKYMQLISLQLGESPPIKTRSLAGHKNVVWPYLDWLGLVLNPGIDSN